MTLEQYIPCTSTFIVLVVGRSYVGKSTLIDSILEGAQTMKDTKYELLDSIKLFQDGDHGVKYAEIPDLSISTTRVEAAKEIRRCLTERGGHKLVFVCALESGRVHADDVTTIKVVLDAINDETFPYSIVFNKMTRQISPDMEKRLLASVISGHKPPDEVFYVPYDKQLGNGDKVTLKPNENFQNFIERQQPGFIQPDKLLDFDFRAFDCFEHCQPVLSIGGENNMLSKSTQSVTATELLLSETGHRPVCNRACNHCSKHWPNVTKIEIMLLLLLMSIKEVQMMPVKDSLQFTVDGEVHGMHVPLHIKQNTTCVTVTNDCSLVKWPDNINECKLQYSIIPRLPSLEKMLMNRVKDTAEKFSTLCLIMMVIEFVCAVMICTVMIILWVMIRSLREVNMLDRDFVFLHQSVLRHRHVSVREHDSAHELCFIVIFIMFWIILCTVMPIWVMIRIRSQPVVKMQEHDSAYGHDSVHKSAYGHDSVHKHDAHIWLNMPRPYIQENIDAIQGQVNISIDPGSILPDYKGTRKQW